MKITVFGASGKVGRQVVSEAVRRGHVVTAFQRHAPAQPIDPAVQIFIGDIYDAAAVAKAIKGSDAVISALGSWGTPKKDILTTGMRHILPAMKQNGINRIITLTGADARAPGDHYSLVHRLTHTIIGFIGKKVIFDSEEHIRLLAASGMDWTVIRSPVMTTLGKADKYNVTARRPLPWQSINRLSVTRAMLDELDGRQHPKSALYISRT